MSDYINFAEEERTIAAGLEALQYFYAHPVRREDQQRCVMIADAIKVLSNRAERAEDDVLYLRTEFEKVVGAGVDLRKAIERSECKNLLHRLLEWGKIDGRSKDRR